MEAALWAKGVRAAEHVVDFGGGDKGGEVITGIFPVNSWAGCMPLWMMLVPVVWAKNTNVVVLIESFDCAKIVMLDFVLQLGLF